MKKLSLIMLTAFLFLSCTREQDTQISSSTTNSSVTTRPLGNIACVCTDAVKSTYHVWLQLDQIDTTTDIVKLKLFDGDSVVNVVFPKVKNGNQNTKIKYEVCGSGVLTLSVVRSGITFICSNWTDLSCDHVCSVSGGSDCPISQ